MSAMFFSPVASPVRRERSYTGVMTASPPPAAVHLPASPQISRLQSYTSPIVYATPPPTACASPSYKPVIESPSSPRKGVGHTPSTMLTGDATESCASFATPSPQKIVQSPGSVCVAPLSVGSPSTPRRSMRLVSVSTVTLPNPSMPVITERTPSLSVGQKVRIVGMASQYQRNWEDGVLEEWHGNLGTKGQWKVQLSNTNVLLEEDNLEIISSTNLNRRVTVHRAMEAGWAKASEDQRLSWLKEFASVSHRGLLERSVATEQFLRDGTYTQGIEWFPFSEEDWRKLAADGCAIDASRSVVQSLDARMPGGPSRRVDMWRPGKVTEPRPGELRWPCCDQQRRRKPARTLREALDVPPCRHSE